jgi:hypothetical protein
MRSKDSTGHWLALAFFACLTVFDGRIVYVYPDFSQENNLKPKDATIATYAELIARRKRMTSYSGGG